MVVSGGDCAKPATDKAEHITTAQQTTGNLMTIPPNGAFEQHLLEWALV
jgi:hypothetical protein